MNVSLRSSRSTRFLVVVLVALVFPLSAPVSAPAEVLWTEGERPAKSSVTRHPWWYDKVKTDQLSNNDFISNWGDKPGTAEYTVTAKTGGDYDFWVRANPVASKLSYSLNGKPDIEIDLNQDQRENTNIADDGKIDLRYIAWERVGRVTLKAGENTVSFRMHSDNNNHGMLDCFVLANEPFEPHGISRTGDVAPEPLDHGYFAFQPDVDEFLPNAGFDLRELNERQAGDEGYIAARNGQFVHSKTGRAVRFWGVNGPGEAMTDPAALRHCARMLAKHGVNLVRLHGAYFDADGNIVPAKVQHALDVVEAMKTEGIYTDFSVYWYSFITPKPDARWLKGYDGKTSPFAALIFNADFQTKYEQWWTALLTTASKTTGKRLIDEPACSSIEIQNEDSLFFWTFDDKNIPDEQMRLIESQFGQWLKRRYGSIDAALKRWNGVKVPRDNPAEGRVGFRPLWNIVNERTTRDQDTVAFMTELQRGFYQKEYAFLRKLGYKGLITTTGWTTASPEYLGPLEKYTNTPGDYMDRHGYFAGSRHGTNDGWALMNDQVFFNRSALRFDPADGDKKKLFVNPVMDPHYDGKPSVISETSFDRPNRYRSEGPLYYACYGALQDSGGFMFFALDADHWGVKPNYFMQPWTLMSPSTMGQYPAAAMIFRQALVSPGDELVRLDLSVTNLEHLKGTPMAQDASLDELRLKDVPVGTSLQNGSVINPLVHYAGRTSVVFSPEGSAPRLVDLAPYIDLKAQTVVSTTRQLKLDYGKGTLIINAPAAQGASGNLKEAGVVETRDLTIQSDMNLGHIVLVSLDGKPVATSNRMLLQVMSQDTPTGFKTKDAGGGKLQIIDIGRDPWLVANFSGSVKLKRADATTLKVSALDGNGKIKEVLPSKNTIELRPTTLYYLISK